ncbi:MAG TPA: hypothetical protein VD978_23210 [Azospirillum sp.]|nr:hypothetical protein [Azospirillum sp.]
MTDNERKLLLLLASYAAAEANRQAWVEVMTDNGEAARRDGHELAAEIVRFAAAVKQDSSTAQ